MQNLIAILLLVFASAYLLLKWMPQSTKTKLRTNYAKQFPALTPLLTKISKSTDGCGSGCNSCASNTGNTCLSTEVKTIQLVGIKHPVK